MKTLILLWVILFFGCEEANMIRSVTLTPEGEVTRHLGQTTFKVSVKVDHDERDADGNPVRIPVIPEEPEVSFNNDILPIFKAHCQECHRHSVRFDPKGGLDLSRVTSPP